MVEALCTEIALQKDYLDTKILHSIYFGGGTPSLLTGDELQQIFDTIRQYFTIADDAEITLEANPDDLQLAKLQTLKAIGINRLSIGVQTFNDHYLQTMNRTHTAAEAIACVENTKLIGFNNFSIDLMYGFPAANHLNWQADIAQVLAFRPTHISTYCLTIEPKTALYHQVKTKQFVPASDNFAAEQYEILIEQLTTQDYQHYEISNFALPTFYARHNSNYWKKGKYLGIGASAHSYNGTTRQANIANNNLYIKAIRQGQIPAEIEVLTPAEHINEYILVNLRTTWGCNREWLATNYNYKFSEKLLAAYAQQGLMVYDSQTVYLTSKGRLLADKICSDFFVVL